MSSSALRTARPVLLVVALLALILGSAAPPASAAPAIDFSCGHTQPRAWASGGGTISFNAVVRCNSPLITVRSVAFDLKRNGGHVIYVTEPGCAIRDDGTLWSCTTSTTTLPRGTFTGGLADWCVDADVHWSMNARNDMDATTACFNFSV